MSSDFKIGDIFKRNPLKSPRRTAAEEKELLRELREKTETDKGDLPALIIAAFTTILPLALVVLFLYYAITMWIFG